MSINKHSNGFTVTELLIVAPIVVLVIGTFIAAIVNMTGDVLVSRSQNSLIYNINDTLSRIEQDIKLSSSFLPSTSAGTNGIPPTAPQGADNSTNLDFKNINTTGSVLILKSVATIDNPLSSTRNLVYLKGSKSCSDSGIDQAEAMPVDVIYFVKNGTLWKRTVMPSGYDTGGCNAITKAAATPWQLPTCAPGLSGTICKTQDTKLVDGIADNTGFIVNYYSSPSSTTPNTIASDITKNDATRLTALQSVNTVNVTINSTISIAGRDVNQSGEIKVTLP